MIRPDPDPLPGDFDEELMDLDPADVQVADASRDRRMGAKAALSVFDGLYEPGSLERLRSKER